MDPSSLALAYSLSGLSGIRASLTLLAVSLCAHAHLIHTGQSMQWIRDPSIMLIAGALAVAELFGDKIPVVDHALHAVHLLLAPVAGGLAAAATVPDPAIATILGLAGAGHAAGIQSIRATARIGSTAVSAGILNPVLSISEDVLALGGILLAVALPVITAILIALTTYLAVRGIRRVRDHASAQTIGLSQRLGRWTNRLAQPGSGVGSQASAASYDASESGG